MKIINYIKAIRLFLGIAFLDGEKHIPKKYRIGRIGVKLAWEISTDIHIQKRHTEVA